MSIQYVNIERPIQQHGKNLFFSKQKNNTMIKTHSNKKTHNTTIQIQRGKTTKIKNNLDPTIGSSDMQRRKPVTANGVFQHSGVFLHHGLNNLQFSTCKCREEHTMVLVLLHATQRLTHFLDHHSAPPGEVTGNSLTLHLPRWWW